MIQQYLMLLGFIIIIKIIKKEYIKKVEIMKNVKILSKAFGLIMLSALFFVFAALQPGLICHSAYLSSSFLDRLIRSWLSISVTLTVTLSPRLSTSSTLSILSLAILEMCSRPSCPGRISTNAPKFMIRLTVPS